MRTRMLEPITDLDVAAVVSLMNRAYRGASSAGWTTEAAYIAGNRTSESHVRATCPAMAG